jgi:hypothetical protein
MERIVLPTLVHSCRLFMVLCTTALRTKGRCSSRSWNRTLGSSLPPGAKYGDDTLPMASEKKEKAWQRKESPEIASVTVGVEMRLRVEIPCSMLLLLGGVTAPAKVI